MAADEILVVGAGPVGLTLAVELARRGTAFRVIDKLAQPTDESRAIVVHARSLEMLDAMGVAEELIDASLRLDCLVAHAGGEELLRVELDGVDSPYPFTASLAQTETERILHERLAALGGEVERPVELTGLEQDDDGLSVRLRDAYGGEREERFGWVVGTDGGGGTVRGQCGMKLEGSFKGERFLLADVEAEYDQDRRGLHIFSHPDGPFLLFPMPGTRVRLIGELGDGPDREPTIDDVQAMADARAGGIRVTGAHWLTVFEIHHGLVPAFRRGRAFLAGDAAHVHSPAGGQGMNTGMQDAFNLGWKLDLAARGRATEALLDSYHAERRPIVEQVVKMTTGLTKVGSLRKPAVTQLRNHAAALLGRLGPIQRLVADETEEIGIAYPDSPIVAGAGRRARRGAPGPGDHAPSVLGLHERLRGTNHVALAIGAGAAPAADELAAGFPGLVDPLALSAPQVAERYGTGDQDALFVIRPDGYIAFRSVPADAAAARACLSRALTPA